MKKIHLLPSILLAALISSCTNGDTLQNHCGETVALHQCSNHCTDQYLYFKNGTGGLDGVKVTSAEYEFYKDGETIECIKN